MRIGIIGAGSIAGAMAKTVRAMKENGEDVSLYAIASRNEEKAAAFAVREGFETYYGNYEAMVRDDKVDLVYIATPHSHHAEHMRLCIGYGKPILCEKAFTATGNQAEEILNLAEQKKVPLTEAIWTRYMPARQMIDERIASGVIGEVTYVTGSLCYEMQEKERVIRPELAGGALLDIGIYPINFASMILGPDVATVGGAAQLGETGVDLSESILLTWKNGAMANLGASARGYNDQIGCICGTNGYIMVEKLNNPQRISVFAGKNQLVETVEVPRQLTGYEYEVRACMRMLAEGKTECPEMPHEETLRVMRLMDRLRKMWGVRYPWD